MLLPAGFAPPAVPVPHPSALILNWPTKLRSWLHISTSCCDAFWVSEAPRVVPWAASATPPMLRVISLLPCAAFGHVRDISLVWRSVYCSGNGVENPVDLVDNLPASRARAASMVAFKASRLVYWAIWHLS